MTRLAARKERGEPIPLPPLTHRYLVEWWMEIGPTEGDGPVSWQGIAAWGEQTGRKLQCWEATAIRRMSSDFLSQRHEARKPTCPAPWSPELPQDVRDKVSVQFAALVKAVGAPQNRVAKSVKGG